MPSFRSMSATLEACSQEPMIAAIRKAPTPGNNTSALLIRSSRKKFRVVPTATSRVVSISTYKAHVWQGKCCRSLCSQHQMQQSCRPNQPATTVMLDATTSVTDSPTNACVRSPLGYVYGMPVWPGLLGNKKWQVFPNHPTVAEVQKYRSVFTKAYCVARLPQQRKTPPASAKPTEGPLCCSKRSTTKQQQAVYRARTSSAVRMGTTSSTCCSSIE